MWHKGLHCSPSTWCPHDRALHQPPQMKGSAPQGPRSSRLLRTVFYRAKGFFLSFFNVRFILLFCLIAIRKVPSEWLTANNVNFQCRYFENLPPSLLSLQQVPREPCWTWAGVSESASWQEPRPFLLVVNKGQSALPPWQAPARWFLQRAGPAPVQFPPARPESGGGLVLQEMWDPPESHTAHPAEVASSAACLPGVGVCLAPCLYASGLS